MKNKEAYLKMSRLLEDVASSCATIELHRLDVDIDYSERDSINALYIMNHVWQTVAIHNGQFATPEKAEEKMSKFREAITECFGIDPAVLARKRLLNELKDNGTKTETNCPKE